MANAQCSMINEPMTNQQSTISNQQSASIQTLDLNFQNAAEAIAAYLIIGPAGPALVETGPGSTLPTLLNHLAQQGFQPTDIKDVLVTHIHLDHAGAAGWWAQQGARVHVHHVGAPHLIDPSKLLASATRIYGERMGPLWGDFLSAPVEQIHALRDGEAVEAGGLRFIAHDTPGHAFHHMTYQLGDVAFTGDVGGIRLSARPHLQVPMPPPEFEPEVWQTSAARLRAMNFTRLYLTHFGAVDNVTAHWDELIALLPQAPALVRECMAQGLDRATTLARFIAWEEERQRAAHLPAEVVRPYNFANPLDMSVDGMMRYWKKRPSSD